MSKRNKCGISYVSAVKKKKVVVVKKVVKKVSVKKTKDSTEATPKED